MESTESVEFVEYYFWYYFDMNICKKSVYLYSTNDTVPRIQLFNPRIQFQTDFFAWPYVGVSQ